METKMIDYINSDIKQYTEFANQLNVDEFTQAVYTSFKEALSRKHYVMLVPVDLDMYYSPEQHKDFEMNGFHRAGSEERYNNIFFATQKVVDLMVEVMEKEGMDISMSFDKTSGVNVAVVTIDGIKDSLFIQDYPQNEM